MPINDQPKEGGTSTEGVKAHEEISIAPAPENVADSSPATPTVVDENALVTPQKDLKSAAPTTDDVEVKLQPQNDQNPGAGEDLYAFILPVCVCVKRLSRVVKFITSLDAL
jgi:hypothetical protein